MVKRFFCGENAIGEQEKWAIALVDVKGQGVVVSQMEMEPFLMALISEYSVTAVENPEKHLVNIMQGAERDGLDTIFPLPFKDFYLAETEKGYEFFTYGNVALSVDEVDKILINIPGYSTEK